jgi:hypothetical protein
VADRIHHGQSAHNARGGGVGGRSVRQAGVSGIYVGTTDVRPISGPTIWPNPAHGSHLIIHLAEGHSSGGISIELLTADGRIVRSGISVLDNEQGIIQFDLGEGITPGLYHLRISYGAIVHSKQVIIVR